MNDSPRHDRVTETLAMARLCRQAARHIDHDRLALFLGLPPGDLVTRLATSPHSQRSLARRLFSELRHATPGHLAGSLAALVPTLAANLETVARRSGVALGFRSLGSLWNKPAIAAFDAAHGAGAFAFAFAQRQHALPQGAMDMSADAEKLKHTGLLAIREWARAQFGESGVWIHFLLPADIDKARTGPAFSASADAVVNACLAGLPPDKAAPSSLLVAGSPLVAGGPLAPETHSGDSQAS